jgi:hypothetical protein
MVQDPSVIFHFNSNSNCLSAAYAKPGACRNPAGQAGRDACLQLALSQQQRTAAVRNTGRVVRYVFHADICLRRCTAVFHGLQARGHHGL